MPARLKITKQSDTQGVAERQFDDEIITIGRSPSSDLILKDSDRIVSRHHAILKLEGDQYYLCDQDSHNGTFVNEMRINANESHKLQDGDKIRIGEYVIEFQIIEADAENPETGRVNELFLEEVKALKGIIKRIQGKYNPHASYESNIHLQQAVQEVFCEDEFDDAIRTLASELLTSSRGAKRPDLPHRGFTETKGRIEQILELFIGAVLSLSQKILKFRSEFIGITIAQRKDSLNTFTFSELNKYLLDPDIPEEEAIQRYAGIKSQIDELLIHEIATLEGYRAVVKQGAQELFHCIDLRLIEAELSQKKFIIGPIKIPYRWVPFFIQFKAYSKLRKRVQEWYKEDRGSLDRKIFRPNFIRAYQQSMLNVRPKESNQ